MPETRYFARSASDNTDDWPYWYVADRERGNLNVTVELVPELSGYQPFLPRDVARKPMPRIDMLDRLHFIYLGELMGCVGGRIYVWQAPERRFTEQGVATLAEAERVLADIT